MYNGLSTQEVLKKTEEGKVNKTVNSGARSYREIISSNLFTYFNLLNIVLFLFVLLTGKLKNGLFIGTVFFNSFIGIYQQIKSKKLLDQLKILSENSIKVKRNGDWINLLPEGIVEGDYLQLKAGMQVPCDCKILDGFVEVDESSLTGESNTIEKHKDSELLAGTIIHAGIVEVIVLRVGNQCEIHRIVEASQQENRSESVLKCDLEKMIRIISYFIIPTALLLYFSQTKIVGMHWDDALLKTIAAVVGMIPEGLVVLTSVALAVSTIRLSQKRILVQDLFSIEALARIDTVCFDKTGTLTTGNLIVEQFHTIGKYESKDVRRLLGSYLSDIKNPNATDTALLHYFSTNSQLKRCCYQPFSSSRKYAACEFETGESIFVGASTILFPDNIQLQNNISEYTKQGKRVLCIGYSKSHLEKNSLPLDLQPCAFIVLQDEIRSNAKEIISYFQKHNIDIRIISGDDPETVASLAKQAGIIYCENAIDMSKNTENIETISDKYTIFGRVRPQEKKEIIQSLKKNGKHVLMSGDGVNDVPAMKIADVSVSIGDAVDAAKNTANIILLENDFSSIPSIVNEGRRVINNISRASSMYLVKTVFSVLISLYVIFMHESYPFLPIHLTMISAIGVGIPTFLLQLEPSFEKISGNFLLDAFLRALPSSLSVFMSAILCMFLKDYFHFDDMRFFGIFILLTGYVYILTLFRVYKPLTKIRVFVISAMAVLFIIALLVFDGLLSVSFHYQDLWIFLLGFVFEPVCMICFDKVISAYGKRKNVFKR